MIRDGRFKVNDEIINVNGSSLRGLDMEAARTVLKDAASNIDIIIARSPEPQRAKTSGATKALSRRKRRLPVIERPKSAPLAGGGGGDDVNYSRGSGATSGDDANFVLDVCDLSGGARTVIKIPSAHDGARHGTFSHDGARSGTSSRSERILPEIARITPGLGDEGVKGAERREDGEGRREEGDGKRSVQVSVHTATFRKGGGAPGLGKTSIENCSRLF